MKPSKGNITVSIDHSSSLKAHYQEIFIGCLLAVIGNLMISISLNIQKYTHNKDEQQQTWERRHYLKRPLWWLGVTLMALGEVGNFTAYGFAPASVVAPLGTSTVIANMFIAVIFLREQLRPEDLFGSALAIVGAFLIVSFSKRKEHVLTGAQLVQSLQSARFIIYVTVELVLLTVLFFMLYVMKKDNVLVLLLITSIIASFTVICAKGVSGLLNLSAAGMPQFDQPVLYIMTIILLATAAVQVYYLNQAMKGSDSTVVVPTNFVFFTISAITSGIVFFNEFWGLYSLSIFMFLLGCFLSFVGVYFITFNRGHHGEDFIDDTTPIKAAAAAADDDRAQRILYDIFPTEVTRLLCSDDECEQSQECQYGDCSGWLLASVNRAEVQPRRSHPQWSGPQEAGEDEKQQQQQQQQQGDQDELICN